MLLEWICENWFGNTIYDWLSDLCEEVFDFLFTFINGLFIDGEALITETAINSAAIITGDIAVVIISIVVLKNVFSIYILETDGDAEQDPVQQLVKAAIAVALIQSSTYLFNWSLNIANVFTSELVLGLEVVIDSPDSFLDSFSNATGGLTQAYGVYVTLLAILIVGMICLIIKAFIRGGELALMKVLFPIFCCDLLTSSRERFNAFITSFIVTTVGYSIQLLCFRLSMNAFLNITDIMHMPIAYTWLFLAIKAPKWLEKYAYTSGLGGLARTGASSAGQVVMMSLARKAA